VHLSVLPGLLAVCRLPEGSDPPVPPPGNGLWSFTRRPGESSLVCAEAEVPPGATAEPGWRALVVDGVLDFGMVGVLAGLSAALADAGVSIVAISTYDTDVLLVRASALDDAITALLGAGYSVGSSADGA
jgi:hypothetical protein